MLGRQERRQQTLFFTCQLADLVPEDHILKRVDRVLDLSWFAAEVEPLYAAGQGRPSIDPEVAVRLMLAGFFEGIVHDRKLLRQAQVNVAIRWFCGYGLDEPLPDHSSLTRIRQRWGAARFRRLFERTVQACVAAGLVTGETVHVDATLIRADVSWESLVARHVERTLEVNAEAGVSDEAPGVAERGARVSRTDPDARVAKAGRAQRGEPAYKQMTAVDDAAGIIVDVAIEPGTAPEGAQLVAQLERVASTTGRAVQRVTADKGYASAANYAALEARGVRRSSRPSGLAGRAARCPVSGSSTTRATTWCDARAGARCGTVGSMASVITTGPRRPCVVVVRSGTRAWRRALRRAWCGCGRVMTRCCEHVVAARTATSAGAIRWDDIAGKSRVCTARPRANTAWRARRGAGCGTSRSRRI